MGLGSVLIGDVGPVHCLLRYNTWICDGACHEFVRFVQVEADVKRLSAENAVLLSQVRDLENKVTLASRELSNSGAPVAAVRSLPSRSLAHSTHTA